MPNRPAEPRHLPFLSTDVLRYGDTDRQGHVNNAVYATYFETGRVLHLQEALGDLTERTSESVLASITIDYLREVHWPGEVRIASGVERVGTTSVTMIQDLFFEDELRAWARSVVVQIDPATRRPMPWTDDARSKFLRLEA